MKRCPECKETKPKSEFSENRAYADGLSRCCEPCGEKTKRYNGEFWAVVMWCGPYARHHYTHNREKFNARWAFADLVKADVWHQPRQRKDKTPTWYCWQGILTHFRNLTATGCPHHDGRGAMVCPRWDDWLHGSFDNFLTDMGEQPEGTNLDKIDDNKGYTPENCRWASRAKQANNKRNKVVCEYGHCY